MRLPIAWATAVAMCGSLLLGGCGAGDPTGVESDRALHVRVGGSGDVYFPGSLRSLPFSNSVTVALANTTGGANQYTIYTLFGLTRLTMTEVPTAALVTFVDGLNAATSSSTELPSGSVGMMLHDGFDQGLVSGGSVLAQDAPTIYERLSTGTMLLEPQQDLSSAFLSQASIYRQVRYSTVTLSDTATSAEVLAQGAAPFQVSTNVSQQFLGYAGNLGLLAQPSTGGGGPPDPPGSGTGTGGTTGGGTTGGTDNPPTPPLR
ncbi:MAG: hypothetical protein HZB16_21940 [Armatimonadetes bacterium]|nr:hypothetical protein [Armatimonadota bacterium]